MFSADQYQLLDVGHGRKLERIGSYVIDRPCPAAEKMTPFEEDAWSRTDARFERTSGERGYWRTRNGFPASWAATQGALHLELKLTDFGHLGIFPEQAENWDWIANQVRQSESPLRLLNLFAYTGGSTLAAAAAGANVVHIDAAKNTVAWARRNAAASGLADAPIRWIVEDALKFVRREIRRGNRYQAIVLDPPSYGHGPQTEAWRIEQLPELLELAARLIEGRPRFVLLTCHSPEFDSARLGTALIEAFGEGEVTARTMTLNCVDGRGLPSGTAAIWAPTP